jgi:hypothetical protein
MYPQSARPNADADVPPIPHEQNGDEATTPLIRARVPARGADAPPTVVATTSEGLVQAVEGLARCLERVIEVLSSDETRVAKQKEELEAAADDLRQAKSALGLAPAQGELSKTGRDAHAAQRADPARSPHFGG